MTSNIVMFHIPTDQELLAALGEVTLQLEHLNYILKMTIKSIADLTPKEAFDATQYEGSGSLRKRVHKLAKQKLGEGASLLKLQAMLTRAQRLTEQRNDLTHGIWAKELDGEADIIKEFGKLLSIPSIEKLNCLANEIETLTNEFNRARSDGFLVIALESKGKNKNIW